MNQKTTTFELYRYQILPIDRYLQGNLFTGVGSVEELIRRKNEFFSEAVRSTKNFSDSRHDTVTKLLHDKEDFFLFRIAINKSIHRETKDFQNEYIDSWPSILVAVWNSPKKQYIAVQKRTTAFSSSEVVIRLILNSVTAHLTNHHLRAIHEAMFEKKKFWSLLKEYEGKIKSVEFEIITPNMANISGSLSDDLKEFAKITNSTRNKLKIESDPEAPLHLDESNKTLRGLVDYSSEGGGNIALKIEGVKKTYQTSKTVKEIHIGDIDLNGDADSVAKIIKDLLL